MHELHPALRFLGASDSGKLVKGILQYFKDVDAMNIRYSLLIRLLLQGNHTHWLSW